MAILYLSSFTPQQAELLTTLNTHRFTVEDFEVAVRYFPGAEKGTEKRRAASLGGYGVEMVLKRTDYLALDDRETGEQGWSGVVSLSELIYHSTGQAKQ